MARSPASFARGKPRFKAQPRVLVLCEDSKSCLQYLRDATRHFRSYAEVEVAHFNHTDPIGIVEEAVSRKHSFEMLFCAIDRDSHESFDEALQLARENSEKVTVIASYPCYEYWLLLHFRKSRKPYVASGNCSAGDNMVKDLCAEESMSRYAKGASKKIFDDLLGKLPDARKRSIEVLQEAVAEKNLNPSTRLHELIALFELLGKPQLIAD